MMKSRCITILVVWAVVFLTGCTKPDYRLADGSDGFFENWHGKWVVINYWAVWCAPCREEIPELNALAQQQPDVLVYGVNFDNAQDAKLREAISEMKIAFPVLTQDPAAQLGYQLPGVLPVTVILNPQGVLHKMLVGPQTQASVRAAMENK